MEVINLRKIIALVVTILFIIIVMGCDSGLKIVGMEIKQYPNKIVYFAEIDNKLDLTGGFVNYILINKSKSSSDMINHSITVTHDIDFNKPGVYVVKLERHPTAVCEFPIQVIELPKDTN